MARTSPVLQLHKAAEAVIAQYGATEAAPNAGVPVVMAYGPIELEYAAIRKASALLDMAQRGTILVTGSERIAFLNRMLTQELKGVAAGDVRRAFWLNRKGRIDGDVRVIIEAERVVLDVDVLAAERVARTLNAYVISEDVVIEDVSERYHRLALHGPAALQVIARWGRLTLGYELEDCKLLAANRAVRLAVGGVEVLVDRFDSTGEIGLELLAPAEGVRAVYEAILQAAHEQMHEGRVNPAPLLRPIGWAAYNIARIEAGTPLYNLDFGPDSLPAETGVLKDRVSFTKGCYLGQEVVARMNALGHPKQQLVSIRITDPAATLGQAVAEIDQTREPQLSRYPQTGAGVYDAQGKDVIGAVTSATLAPLLSRQPVAFAMLRWASVKAGTGVKVDCDGALLDGVVQEELPFVKAK